MRIANRDAALRLDHHVWACWARSLKDKPPQINGRRHGGTSPQEEVYVILELAQDSFPLRARQQICEDTSLRDRTKKQFEARRAIDNCVVDGVKPDGQFAKVLFLDLPGYGYGKDVGIVLIGADVAIGWNTWLATIGMNQLQMRIR